MSKWIPVTERLPNDGDADKFGLVQAIGVDGRQHLVAPITVKRYPSFTHWMTLPLAPRVSDRTESPEPASGEDLEGERGPRNEGDAQTP